MRIVLVTFGTEGDTRPLLALARGLEAAGHDPLVISDVSGADLAHAVGVEFEALPGDMRAQVTKGLGAWMMRTAVTNPLAMPGFLSEVTLPWLKVLQGVLAQADVAVGAGMATYHVLSAAEVAGIPAVTATMQPNLPTEAWPSVSTGLAHGPAWANKRGGEVIKQMEWRTFRAPIMDARGALRQPTRPDEWTGHPMLGAWSPTLVPTPADWAEYPEGHRLTVTGDWPLALSTASVPERVVSFLDAGAPPVYVGFGSMMGRDSARVLRRVLDGLDGRRAVLAGGWAGLPDYLPDNVCAVDRIEHDWLFPRCAAVVHHAGAGTSHAAARWGVGSVPIPLVADQPFWAARLREQGVASEPLPRRFSAKQFADALAEATSTDMKYASARLAEKIRREDGVRAAVEVIEKAAE